ncbi:MAG: hypothetical protein WAM88_09130 [Nitrososphaeraceae archaeon]
MKLLEFALIAVSEALRQDPQMELLIEKTPLQNYDSYSSSLSRARITAIPKSK